MSQDYSAAFSLTDNPHLVLTAEVPDSLEALRSLFSGATAPSSPVDYQLWADTTTGLLKMWNGSTWKVLFGLNVPASRIDACDQLAAVSTTKAIAFFTAVEAAQILDLSLISDTATTSSSGNEWQWSLRNVTQSLELFSGTVGTFTTLGGVGGGELAVETAYKLTVDQNGNLAAGDVLRFTATAVGSVTTIVRLGLQLGGHYIGA